MDRVTLSIDLALTPSVIRVLKNRAIAQHKSIAKIIEELLVCGCGELLHTCNCDNDE